MKKTAVIVDERKRITKQEEEALSAFFENGWEILRFPEAEEGTASIAFSWWSIIPLEEYDNVVLVPPFSPRMIQWIWIFSFNCALRWKGVKEDQNSFPEGAYLLVKEPDANKLGVQFLSPTTQFREAKGW